MNIGMLGTPIFFCDLGESSKIQDISFVRKVKRVELETCIRECQRELTYFHRLDTVFGDELSG